MRKTKPFPFHLIIIVILASLAGFGPARAKEPEENPAAGKKTAYTGDPARKRGMELGFDEGLKLGRADQNQGLDPNPKAHSEFNDPSKAYRYEYGSRANFNAGYRSGFLGGYQQAYGKAVKIKPEQISESSPTSSHSETPPPSVKASPSPTPHKTQATPPKQKKVDVTSDAL